MFIKDVRFCGENENQTSFPLLVDVKNARARAENDSSGPRDIYVLVGMKKALKMTFSVDLKVCRCAYDFCSH